MEIDNFEEIRKHLTFETQFDRYLVHIIKRAKDENGKDYGVNENQRMIMTKVIPSIDYLDHKMPMFKDMCVRNNARAYILPQVRHNGECLKQLLKLIVDNLDNPTIKPEHLIRSAYCGYHGSRDKKWILDLDNDNMTEYIEETGFPHSHIRERKWTPDEVLEFVRNKLVKIGKTAEDAYMIPTRNGHCIVTSPFNLKEAQEECNMVFEGSHDVTTGFEKKERADPLECRMPYYFKSNVKSTNGWLIKDGMALLYYCNG